MKRLLVAFIVAVAAIAQVAIAQVAIAQVAIAQVAIAQVAIAQVAVGHAQTVTRRTSLAGLEFRHVHMPEDQFQVLLFAWRDGTSTVPGKEAIAALGTALIIEGPRGSTRSAMVEDLRDLQATATLAASIGIVQGNLTAPREKFAEAARLFARTLADPALPADRLAELARNRAAASRQSAASAEALAQRLLWRLLIADGPHRRHATGEPAMFERVTVADVDQWRRGVLTRQGVMLVMVGPMDATQAGHEIDRVFGGLPQSGGTGIAPTRPILRAPGKLVVLERPVVQTAVAAGGPIASAIAPDAVRTQLGTAVLGGSPSARLWLAVRERLGAAYGISAGLATVDLSTRALVIRTAVANDKAKDVLGAVRDEYARFVVDGPTDGELEALKAIFVRSHRERLRRPQTLAASLLTAALHDFPDDYLATYEPRLRGYDRTAVATDVRAALPKPPLTTVMVAPSGEGLSADCVIKSPDELARCE